MKNIPIYGKKTLILAFEFALILSETAKERGIKLTPEISTRAEEILLQEINTNGYKKTTYNFVPLVLAALEAK